MTLGRRALAESGQPWTRIDRFVVEAELGRGGMGCVYRVRDAHSGEVRALKLANAGDQASRSAIRYEFQMLSRLSIAGIVRAREQGCHAGLDYFVMDYVEGASLREHLATEFRLLAAGPRVASLPALPVLAELAATLSELHALGIVHGDLKPENVIVSRDAGRPVLIDFALARGFRGEDGRDALALQQGDHGTHAYMAPERFLGGPLDPRTDLYALGCILYEALTGVQPFVGDRVALRAAHLQSMPAGVRQQNAGVPAELAELVSKLLAKEARRRPGYASDVASALRGSHAGAPRAADPTPSYVYRPAWIGRSRELERIERALASGEGEPVIVSGTSGLGKTRLLLELSATARARGIRTVSAECVPLEPSSASSAQVRAGALHPFRKFLSGLSDACRAYGSCETERLFGTDVALLALVEPALKSLPREQPDALELSPQGAGPRLVAAMACTLRRFAADGPVWVFVDDLQWADDITLALVEQAQRGELELGQARLVAALRSEEPGPARACLERCTPARLVALDGLDGCEIAAMACSMLALEHCPEELAELLRARAEGNPLFVAEYLRLALENGALTRASSGRWQFHRSLLGEASAGADGLPVSLRSLLARRLEHQAPEARALALAAATIGREGALGLLRAVARLERFDAALEELCAGGVLVSDGESYRFCHDQLRELCYRSASLDERRNLHAQIAAELERTTDPHPNVAILLAHHHTNAHAGERALDHLERAADLFLFSGEYADALEAVLRAISLAVQLGRRAPIDARRRGNWERRAAVANLHLGRAEACKAHALRALSLLRGSVLPASGLGWCLVLGASVARQLGHLALPRAVYEREGEREPLLEAAEAAAAVSRAAFFAGEPLPMVTASLIAVNLAERAGSRTEAARDYANLGYLCGLFRVRALSEHYFGIARAGKQVTVDALILEALYLTGNARWSAARASLERAERIQRLTRDPQDEEIVQTLAGHPDHYCGMFQSALERYARVLASSRKRGNLQSEAWALYCTARSLVALGFPERAADLATQAHAIILRVPDPSSEVTCLGILVRAAVMAGDLARAERPAERLRELLEETQPTTFLATHGHEGLAEYELHRLARAIGATSSGARRAEKVACREIERLAGCLRTFPLAEPWVWRLRAEAHRALGRAEPAEHAMRASLRSAIRLGMRFDAAQAHAQLARCAASAMERDMHRKHAVVLYGELGCAPLSPLPAAS